MWNVNLSEILMNPNLPSITPRRHLRRAFTLVELLVVLAIIGVLVALLMPSLARARRQAKNTHCLSNLRQLGIAVRTFAEDRESVLPKAELLPSQPVDPANPLPRIADVLGSELGAGDTNAPGNRVFECPADNLRRFAKEGSSYEWNIALNGRRIDETRSAQLRFVQVIEGEGQPPVNVDTNQVVAFPPVTTPLLFDYDEFHPRPPQAGKNAVFMDGHAESLDGMLR
jgi:prepilin-type N-terminal cleavage/methylation domain-containing protein